MRDQWKPRHIVTMAVAVAAAVIAAPVAVGAATGQLVNIVDPTTSTQAAKVSSNGQLNVGDGSGPMTVDGTVISRPNVPTSSLNTSAYSSTGTYGVLGPTTATLAITRLSVYNNGLNSSYANTTFVVALSKGTWDSTNGCRATGARMNMLRSPIGSTQTDSWPTPLVFQPTGTAQYCVMVTVAGESADPGSYYLPLVFVTAYVAKGTYTGNGVATAPAAQTAQPAPAGPDRPPLATKANPKPAGANTPVVEIGSDS